MNAGAGCFGIRLSKNRIGPRGFDGPAATADAARQASTRQSNTHDGPRKKALFRGQLTFGKGMGGRTGDNRGGGEGGIGLRAAEIVRHEHLAEGSGQASSTP